MEIIGTGYGYSGELKIGESYLQENVISMWGFAPMGAFKFYGYTGNSHITFTLQRITKTGESTSTFETLSTDQVTQEMKDCLTEKGYTF